MCRSIFETKCDADETGVTRCGQEDNKNINNNINNDNNNNDNKVRTGGAEDLC